jgi:excisionase family DNA binding protein
MAKINEEVYTPNEVSELLKVKPDTIRRWLKDGILKGVRAGRLWRIPERELQEFLGNHS